MKVVLTPSLYVWHRACTAVERDDVGVGIRTLTNAAS